MKPPLKYPSAAAFRAALEDRLKKLAISEGIDLQRLRRQVAFDRLLCRLFANPDCPWLLKGGYAMELRLKAARTTRDIDLALKHLPLAEAGWEGNESAVLEALREAGQLEAEDFFTFVFGSATQDLEAAPYGGARFPVDARLAGRSFVKFHLDVSTGDVLSAPYDALTSRNWLGFAGVASAVFPAVSPEEQFAEKLHAYTLPRSGRENTRVKDLVDIVLLIERTGLNVPRLRTAIRETFQRRKTHDVPAALPVPPTSWSAPFAELAGECGLPTDMTKHFGRVETFFHELAL